MPAEVATKGMVGAVVGLGDATMFTGCDIAAVGTKEAGGEAAAVEEKDALFALLETVDEFIGEHL